MKIAMIGQKIIPSRAGGIEVHVMELAQRMVKLGCEVDVICRKSHCTDKKCIAAGNIDRCQYKGINIICVSNIKTKNFDAISYSFKATMKALFGGYDVIHYHALGPATMAIIPRILRKKVVCTVHGLDWQRAKWGLMGKNYLKFGEFASARFVNRTITVGEKLVEYYLNKYQKEIIYIPNGIERPKSMDIQVIAEKYGIEKDGYILFLARLVPEKNCHELIEVFKKSTIKKKLVIAGGSSHSDAYEDSLHELAKGDDRILFTGFITGRILEELYSNAYFYVLPSSIEGLPISLLEAMSYGNCCLISDIDENMAVIQDKDDTYGHSFKVGDDEAMLHEMEYLVNHPKVVEAYKEKASDYITDKYNWDSVVLQTLEVYRGLYSKERVLDKKLTRYEGNE